MCDFALVLNKFLIGYIMRKDIAISELGKKYLEEVSKFNDKILE